MRRRWFLAATLTMMLAGAGRAEADVLYGADMAGDLFTINTTTGAGTLVGIMPLGTTEIVYNAGTGTAYNQTPDGGFAIYPFDITTATPTGAPVFDGASFNGLAYVGSTLYGTAIGGPGGPSSLLTLDPTTGLSTLIGLTGFGPISGLAYNPTNTTLYGVTGGSGPSEFLTLNLTTGAATPVGSTGVQLGSLRFGPGGLLYAGSTGAVGGGGLYRIDPATGGATLVGPTGFASVTGLASVPTAVPEPSSLVLLGSGLLALSGVALRRRRRTLT